MYIYCGQYYTKKKLTVGIYVGKSLGERVGLDVGFMVVGWWDGFTEGWFVGCLLGFNEGNFFFCF